MLNLRIPLRKKEEIDCPIQALGVILGKKWVGKIIWAIGEDRKRYGELQRMLEGCTKKMLSQQLDLLITYHIVENEKFEKNNSVESFYYLTEKGIQILPVIEKIMVWGEGIMQC